MTLLPLATDPDTCPACGVNHDRIEDEMWACPMHGHQLQFADVTDAGLNRFTCPARSCKYERCAPRTSKGNPMTEIAIKADPTPRDLVWKKEAQISAVLPEHIDAKAFIGTALAALSASGKLMEAAESDPASLIAALLRCASLGHRPGTDEFYLVPRKIKGQLQVTGIEGYRGIIERMYRSGAVQSVIVNEVCANDRFTFTPGLDDKPVHRFGSTNSQNGAAFFGPEGMAGRGEMVGVYAYAIMKSGSVSRVVVLTKADVMDAKANSEGSDSQYSPWQKHERAMWWKTAARRLEPWVPTSAEYRREELRAEAAAAPAIEDAVDAEVVEER